MKLMLLAAGLGTRLRPVTDARAKPAVPFLNIPLLYYPFSLAEPLGIDELVVNTHHRPEQVAELARAIPGFAGRVRVSHEAEKPLGSGGGVQSARRWLEAEADFLVANGDEVIFPSRPDAAAELMRRHRASGALATLLVMRHPQAGGKFGAVWTARDGRVSGFGKQRPDGSGADDVPLHYVGVVALSRRVFKHLPDGESNLLYDALLAGLRDGETVRVFEDPCVWFETGNIPDFLAASRRMLEIIGTPDEPGLFKRMTARFARGHGRRPEWGGLNFVGADVRAAGRTTINGFAVIGDGCVLGRDCALENCVLLPGARVPDEARLADTILV